MDTVSLYAVDLASTATVLVSGAVAGIAAALVLRRAWPLVLLVIALVGELVLFLNATIVIGRTRPAVPHLGHQPGQPQPRQRPRWVDPCRDQQRERGRRSLDQAQQTGVHLRCADLLPIVQNEHHRSLATPSAAASSPGLIARLESLGLELLALERLPPTSQAPARA